MNYKCLLLLSVWYISDCSARHFYSGLFNDKDAKSATNIHKNENNHKLMKRLAPNPYETLYQNLQTNLKIGSDDVLSTLDYAKPRIKRMNHKDEEENEIDDDMQALFDEVFGNRSIDSSKLATDNEIADQTLLNDPGLNENIKRVFGSATSQRLLAINNMNEQTVPEGRDKDFALTEKTNLNEMIFKNFGPEILDDEPETTTDADAVKPAPDSSNALSITTTLYLLIPLIYFYEMLF